MLDRIQGLFAKKSQGIGVEITPQQINIAQLRSSDRGYQLTTFASNEVPEGAFEDGKIVDPPAISDLIQQTLSENNLKASRVATAVPMRDAIVRLIPVPAELDDRELQEIVLNQEAGLYLPYPREEVDLDYQKLGYFEDEDGIEKVQVLLVATRKEITNVYLEIFREAELKVDFLEINSFALMRTIREQLRQFSSSEAALLLDLEFDSTELAIVVDGVPHFNRTVPIGAYQLQSALSQAMNLPPSRNIEHLQEMTIPVPGAEGQSLTPGITAVQKVLGELADEIRRSVDFYLNQSEGIEVAQMLLAGLGAAIGNIDDFFSHRLSLPTTLVDPIAALSIQTSQEIPPGQRSRLGTVLGLGMREI